MWKRLRTAWFSKTAYDQMMTEADRVFPNETGGILVGYWAIPFREVVVMTAIGPGPHATHNKDRFVPDSEYQEAQIAQHYKASGHLHTYLGDWHTHPNSSAHLSQLDRKTLKVIARYPEARASIPIMAIAAGGTPWTLGLWCGIPVRLGKMNFGMRTSSFKITIFR